MHEPVTIQLYASACTRNNIYLEQLRKTADQLGLSYTLEKISTDEAAAADLGLCYACQSYCPGCKVMHEEITYAPDQEKQLPALFINGQLRYYNYHPDQETLTAILSEYV